MLQREDCVRLQHMLDAAEKAKLFAEGKNLGDLESDDKLALALVRLLEIVGEAAKSVSEQVRGSHPEIAWKAIAGTRDRLIHGYFDVDLEIVWLIVRDDLPVLVGQLQGILKES